MSRGDSLAWPEVAGASIELSINSVLSTEELSSNVDNLNHSLNTDNQEQSAIRYYCKKIIQDASDFSSNVACDAHGDTRNIVL